MLGVAIEAGANHSVTSWLSTSDTAGTAPSTPAWRAIPTTARESSSRPTSRWSPADTDTSIDIYERAGVDHDADLDGPAGGNGALNAEFYEASKDGSRVLFETDESLVGADTDADKDVYERVGSTTNLVSAGPTSGNARLTPSSSGRRRTACTSSS